MPSRRSSSSVSISKSDFDSAIEDIGLHLYGFFDQEGSEQGRFGSPLSRQSGSFRQYLAGNLHQFELAFGIFSPARHPRNGVKAALAFGLDPLPFKDASLELH